MPGWYTKTYLAGRPEARTEQSSSTKAQEGRKHKQITTPWKALQTQQRLLLHCLTPVTAEHHIQSETLSNLNQFGHFQTKGDISVSISTTTFLPFLKRALKEEQTKFAQVNYKFLQALCFFKSKSGTRG